MKVALVLPAFDTKSVETIPKNREDLLRLLKSGHVTPIKFNSHEVVNIDRWIDENEDNEFYQLGPKAMSSKLYEPYFIAPTSIPLYVSENFLTRFKV